MSRNFVNQAYCSNLIRVEAYSNAERRYLPMDYDSVDSRVHGFNDIFTSIESIAGGRLYARLRIYNESIPASQDFIVLKFDFSEAFNFDPVSRSAYNSPDLNLYKAVKVQLRVGLPNQDSYHSDYRISTDYHVGRDGSIVGLVLSRNSTINNTVNNDPKFAVFRAMPRIGEFIPLEVSITLDSQYLRYLEQKRVSVKVPENFAEFNESMAEAQRNIYSVADYAPFLTQGENRKAFYPRHIGYYFNNQDFHMSGSILSVPFYLHSLQYYAGQNVKHGTDPHKVGRYMFELHHDEAYDQLPRRVLLNTASPRLSADEITYVGHDEPRPLPEIMMEVMGYAKHVSYMVHRRRASVGGSGVFSDSTLTERLDKLERCVVRLVDGICDAKTHSNYHAYSGDDLSDTESYFYNMFIRILLAYLDWLRYDALGDDSRRNDEHYRDLFIHLNCIECYEPAYCFPLPSNLTSEDFENNLQYVGTTMLLYDLFNYMEHVHDFVWPHQRWFDRAANNFVPLLRNIVELVFRSSLYDSTQETTGDELNVAQEDLAYLGVTLALGDQILRQHSTLSMQPWHPILKHFKLSGVNTTSVTLLTHTGYNGLDLTEENTYTEQQLLQILSDVDIMSMMLYTVVDNVFSKQTSTTLSLKISATNY